MAKPEVPDSMEQMLYQVWFAVIGNNGDGLVSKVNNIEPIVMKLDHQHKTRRMELLTFIPVIIACTVTVVIELVRNVK